MQVAAVLLGGVSASLQFLLVVPRQAAIQAQAEAEVVVLVVAAVQVAAVLLAGVSASLQEEFLLVVAVVPRQAAIHLDRDP